MSACRISTKTCSPRHSSSCHPIPLPERVSVTRKKQQQSHSHQRQRSGQWSLRHRCHFGLRCHRSRCLPPATRQGTGRASKGASSRMRNVRGHDSVNPAWRRRRRQQRSKSVCRRGCQQDGRGAHNDVGRRRLDAVGPGERIGRGRCIYIGGRLGAHASCIVECQYGRGVLFGPGIRCGGQQPPRSVGGTRGAGTPRPGKHIPCRGDKCLDEETQERTR